MKVADIRDSLISHVETAWEEFETQVLKNPDFGGSLFSHIKLNKRFLQEAIEHTLVDLNRWVKFHNFQPGDEGSKLPDRFKYAGFLSKWVAKIRPVYIEDGHPLQTQHFYVNAFFALWIFRSFISLSFKNELLFGMIYIYHFREMRGENLAFLAYAIDKTAGKAGKNS